MIQKTYDEFKDDESVNPSLFWEMIKLKVREKSLRYSKIKTKQTKQRQLSVEQTIARLQEELDSINTDEKLNESRLELEEIIEFRTKGAILRSKTRWYNEGEKNTKYFLNLEKRHYKQGTISEIKVNDREFVNSHEEILIECVSFYKNLYSPKSMTYDQNETTFFPKREHESAFHDHEQTACEGALTEKNPSNIWEPKRPLGMTVCQLNFTKYFGTIYLPSLLEH